MRHRYTGSILYWHTGAGRKSTGCGNSIAQSGFYSKSTEGPNKSTSASAIASASALYLQRPATSHWISIHVTHSRTHQAVYTVKYGTSSMLKDSLK